MGDVAEDLLRFLLRSGQHDPNQEDVRNGVAVRARGRCEYCLMRTGGQFQIDHIIPPALWARYAAGRYPLVRYDAARRGPDHLDNFAWTCPFCNQAKKQRITGRARGGVSRLYNPRIDRWEEHFAFIHDYVHIIGVTEIGQATERVLDFNDRRQMNHVGPRHTAILNGEYPPDWVRHRLISI